MGTLRSILIIIGIITLGLFTIALGLSVFKHISVNEKPVISVDNTILNSTVGDPIIINATVTDDGTITSVIWDQVAGPRSNFTQVNNDLYFTPTINGTYIFKLEVQDDKQAISEIGVQIIVVLPPTTIPPKPICTVDQVYNPASNKCDHKPTPPPPQPATKDIKVVVVGDIADSTAGNAVFSQIMNKNADYDFVLGDLGYKSNLDWFKSTYGTLGNKLECVIGNHEASNEDGSAGIEQESKKFCGNSYWVKNGATLFVVLNTNDPDIDTLDDKTKTKVFTNSSVMTGIKTVHIMSHKPCATPPKSHHPLGEDKEVVALCDAIKANIPSGLKVFWTQAHNHVMSSSADGIYKQVGSGGKSHYTCGTSIEFPFCDNSHYGFLLYTIKPDGTTTSQFLDYNGGIVK